MKAHPSLIQLYGHYMENPHQIKQSVSIFQLHKYQVTAIMHKCPIASHAVAGLNCICIVWTTRRAKQCGKWGWRSSCIRGHPGSDKAVKMGFLVCVLNKPRSTLAKYADVITSNKLGLSPISTSSCSLKFILVILVHSVLFLWYFLHQESFPPPRYNHGCDQCRIYI